MNIGLRTLGEGASIQLGDGPVQSYPPNYFRQFSFSEFTGIASPAPNQTVSIFVTAGSLFLYASTTDNRTNDSGIQFVTNPTTR